MIIIIIEQKTLLQSLRKQNSKNVKVETDRVEYCKISRRKNNRTERVNLYRTRTIYRLNRYFLLKNSNRNTKPGWKIRLGEEIKKLRLK